MFFQDLFIHLKIPIGGLARWDFTYSFTIGYDYDEERFGDAIDSLWKVIDLICCLFVLICTRFYEYPTPLDYMNSVISYYQNKWRKNIIAQKMLDHITKVTYVKLPNFASLIS
jgi:hypothetical protein